MMRRTGRTFSIATTLAAATILAASAHAATVSLALSSPQHGQTVPPGATISWSIHATVSTGDNLGLALISVDLVQDAGAPATVDLLPATPDAALADFDRPRGLCNPGSPSGFGGTPAGPPGGQNLLQIGGAQNTFGVAGAGIGEGTYTYELQGALANVLTAINPAPLQSIVEPATVILAAPLLSFTVGGLAGDLDGSGCVDQSDLGILLANFGCEQPGPCPGDVDGDGDTDQGDLGALLAFFGQGPNCP
jgi:hypothetical protein